MSGDEHLADPELACQRDRVERPRPTTGEQGVVVRVDSALGRERADLGGHVRHADPDEACGGVEQIEAERRADRPLERGRRESRVDLEPATEQRPRAETSGTTFASVTVGSCRRPRSRRARIGSRAWGRSSARRRVDPRDAPAPCADVRMSSIERLTGVESSIQPCVVVCGSPAVISETSKLVPPTSIAIRLSRAAARP